MAYINAQEVAAIRAELKAQLPEYKFGVRKGPGSLSVEVSILSGPVDFGHEHKEVNHYWMHQHFADRPDALAVLEQIEQIIKTAPANAPGGSMWFDKSDSMTDYFHTAFYYHIHVGKWNTPYTCTKAYA
jgi:hypothetical protein